MNNQPTTPRDDQSADEPFLSRQQYRQQQANQRRQRSSAPEEDPATPEMHRRDFADERVDQDREEKVHRLKWRLNITIVALVAAIIVVYLILFYVG